MVDPYFRTKPMLAYPSEAYRRSGYGQFAVPDETAVELRNAVERVLESKHSEPPRPLSKELALALRALRRVFWTIGTGELPDWFSHARSFGYPSSELSARYVADLGLMAFAAARNDNHSYLSSSKRFEDNIGFRVLEHHAVHSRDAELPHPPGMIRLLWQGDQIEELSASVTPIVSRATSPLPQRQTAPDVGVLACWLTHNPALAEVQVEKALAPYRIRSGTYKVQPGIARSAVSTSLRLAENLKPSCIHEYGRYIAGIEKINR